MARVVRLFAVLLGFIELLARQFQPQHREVTGDDGALLSARPVATPRFGHRARIQTRTQPERVAGDALSPVLPLDPPRAVVAKGSVGSGKEPCTHAGEVCVQAPCPRDLCFVNLGKNEFLTATGKP